MRFDYYHEPNDLRECIELLVHYGPEASLLGGGTDIIPKLKSGKVQKKALISLGACNELKGIGQDPEGNLIIGSMNTLRDIASSNLIRDGFEIISKGASTVSSMQVRNVATLGGNSCNAAPSADTVPGLISTEAMTLIKGAKGDRILPLENFFESPGKTVLKTGEILLGFRVPAAPPLTGGAYIKYSIRGNTDLAIVGVATRLTLDNSHIVRKVRIVLGAVAPTPIRVRRAEEMIQDRALDEKTIEEAAKVAAEESKPISDQRASAQYRRDMVRVCTRNCLKEAFKKASNNLPKK